MTIATQTTGKQWTVASQSLAGTLYIVKLVDGRYSCDCPGHYYRGRCKHADAVAEREGKPEWQRRGGKVDPAIGLALLRGQR